MKQSARKIVREIKDMVLKYMPLAVPCFSVERALTCLSPPKIIRFLKSFHEKDGDILGALPFYTTINIFQNTRFFPYFVTLEKVTAK